VIVTVTYHDHHLGTFSVQSLFVVISSSIFHIYSLINFPSYNHFLSIIDDSAQILVVCAGLNESAAARRVFFFYRRQRRRQRTENTRFSTKFKVTQSCEAMT